MRGPSLAEIGFASFIGPSPAKEHHCRSLGRKKRERESEPRAGHQVVKVQPQPFPHKVTFRAPPSAAPVTRHPTPMIVGNSHPSNRPSIHPAVRPSRSVHPLRVGRSFAPFHPVRLVTEVKKCMRERENRSDESNGPK